MLLAPEKVLAIKKMAGNAADVLASAFDLDDSVATEVVKQVRVLLNRPHTPTTVGEEVRCMATALCPLAIALRSREAVDAPTPEEGWEALSIIMTERQSAKYFRIEQDHQAWRRAWATALRARYPEFPECVCSRSQLLWYSTPVWVATLLVSCGVGALTLSLFVLTSGRLRLYFAVAAVVFWVTARLWLMCGHEGLTRQVKAQEDREARRRDVQPRAEEEDLEADAGREAAATAPPAVPPSPLLAHLQDFAGGENLNASQAPTYAPLSSPAATAARPLAAATPTWMTALATGGAEGAGTTPTPTSATVTAHTASAVPSALKEARWSNALSPSLTRAAGEIYAGLRNQGGASVRDWLTTVVTRAAAAGAWNELWLLASQVDYLLAACTSETEILATLNASDQAELALRRIASWQYVQRTGDQSGGDRILGAVAPGRLVDVAPAWMIADATLHSKMEHQRASRVREQQGGGGQLNQRQNRPPPTTPAAAGESRGTGRGGGGSGGKGRGRGRGRN